MTASRVPPRIPSYQGGSFAHFTVTRRIPKILSDVRAELDERCRRDPRWSELETAIVGGAPIELGLFTARSRFWQDRLSSLRGRTWAEQPFFDLEFLFYLAIDSITQDLRPGIDVFKRVREAALEKALPPVLEAVQVTHDLPLERAIALAVAGNVADLSQLRQDTDSPREGGLLLDDTPLLERVLANSTSGTVQILADNAGSELCFDLTLIDVLLRTRPGRVVLQLKPFPMFVSDALVSDAEQTMSAFIGAGGALAEIGARLQQARNEGRLALEAPAEWGEPRHMNGLDDTLSASLSAADAVIAKGDLNYRRFFEDRAWPADTAVAAASVAPDMRAFALRVLKSDCLVGLERTTVERLSAAEPDWRSNGRHAIIQRVDRGA